MNMRQFSAMVGETFDPSGYEEIYRVTGKNGEDFLVSGGAAKSLYEEKGYSVEFQHFLYSTAAWI